MAYPLIDKTYFATQDAAWRFASAIGRLKTWGVSDYGYEAGKAEPYFVETINDPFATKSEIDRMVEKRIASRA